MARKTRTLDDLRKEIDRIDDTLHDLLQERSALACEIAAVKKPAAVNAAPALRPAREAAILRRLLARHKGELPAQAVVRIWREILSSSLQLQTRFHVHVLAGESNNALFDVARAHFGSLTPLKAHTRTSLVVHACAEEPESLGVVPLPDVEEKGAPWWGQLAPAGQPGPRIFAKLPFLADDKLAAFGIGAIEHEASGDDTTLLRLEILAGLSRAGLTGMLKEAGLDASLLSAGHSGGNGGGSALLLGV